MVCTRHRFISSVGDDQEKYYEQKYVLTVPITPQSQAILEPPQSPSPHSPRQYWSLLSPHHPTVPGNTGASSVPITPQSQAILMEPPQSWVEFCAKQGMCDKHVDAMACMQSAVSRGFHTDALRQLAQVCMEHSF